MDLTCFLSIYKNLLSDQRILSMHPVIKSVFALQSFVPKEKQANFMSHTCCFYTLRCNYVNIVNCCRNYGKIYIKCTICSIIRFRPTFGYFNVIFIWKARIGFELESIPLLQSGEFIDIKDETQYNNQSLNINKTKIKIWKLTWPGISTMSWQSITNCVYISSLSIYCLFFR